MHTVESIPLRPGRAVYFASDFHLGTPTPQKSRERERRVVRWLDSIRHDAEVIFLVGDLFDFWFEYRKTIPKGFIRLQGKLAELSDAGHRLVIFTGNHDMWMRHYFTDELGIPVYRQPRSYRLGNRTFFIGHGDGLGPGDWVYKKLKVVFENPLARGVFNWLHPDVGVAFADRWSRRSRAANEEKGETFLGEEREWLLAYAREVEARHHHDYYIFGHRHLPLDLKVSDTSRYINLGEWLTFNTYARFDGERTELLTFSGE